MNAGWKTEEKELLKIVERTFRFSRWLKRKESSSSRDRESPSGCFSLGRRSSAGAGEAVFYIWRCDRTSFLHFVVILTFSFIFYDNFRHLPMTKSRRKDDDDVITCFPFSLSNGSSSSIPFLLRVKNDAVGKQGWTVPVQRGWCWNVSFSLLSPLFSMRFIFKVYPPSSNHIELQKVQFDIEMP